MNSLRIKIKKAHPDQIVVRSTLDASRALSARADERLQWGQNDVIIVKNQGEAPCALHVKGLIMTDGDTVIRTSRGRVHLLIEDSKLDLTLDGGEALIIRSSLAQDPKGNGRSVTT